MSRLGDAARPSSLSWDPAWRRGDDPDWPVTPRPSAGRAPHAQRELPPPRDASPGLRGPVQRFAGSDGGQRVARKRGARGAQGPERAVKPGEEQPNGRGPQGPDPPPHSPSRETRRGALHAPALRRSRTEKAPRGDPGVKSPETLPEGQRGPGPLPPHDPGVGSHATTHTPASAARKAVCTSVAPHISGGVPLWICGQGPLSTACDTKVAVPDAAAPLPQHKTLAPRDRNQNNTSRSTAGEKTAGREGNMHQLFVTARCKRQKTLDYRKQNHHSPPPIIPSRPYAPRS